MPNKISQIRLVYICSVKLHCNPWCSMGRDTWQWRYGDVTSALCVPFVCRKWRNKRVIQTNKFWCRRSWVNWECTGKSRLHLYTSRGDGSQFCAVWEGCQGFCTLDDNNAYTRQSLWLHLTHNNMTQRTRPWVVKAGCHDSPSINLQLCTKKWMRAISVAW
jgi:hypothetical protein